VGVTIGLGSALLAWKISLDIPWLRLCFVIVFLFGGLFLKRVLKIGALGSAIGLPAALVMIVPDVFPPRPEVLVDFVLWIWWCVILGLSVNAGVQILLSPGDPLMLLRGVLDTRLLAVEHSLRRLAGSVAMEPPDTSLNTFEIVGMSRPLALLKSASIIHRWARERHVGLAAIITLVDRLVTDAIALQTLAPLSGPEISNERLLKVADGCELTRRTFAELRLPSPSEWKVLAAEKTTDTMYTPLTDMERTLDQIALALPGCFEDPGVCGAVSDEKPGLFLPDAFDNPEYVRFAIKGSLAAFICYVCFIGFDYPGIYTSVVTCFVVALSTIGASNQKGTLRFGGAAVGGGMALIALVYLLPNFESIGGFWLVFCAGTAVAAWVNFGTPRISYGGYQIGLAFYKGVLQGFGPAMNLTVIRDRLIGIFFGLVVFGLVESMLWPVRAADALRARLAEIIRLLAELARTGAGRATPTISDDVDSWRRLISQKVEDIQGLIESSKFELGAFKLSEIQKFVGDAQIIFILLLTLAHERHDVTAPNVVRAAAVELDDAMAAVLLALSARIASDSQPAAPDLEGMMDSLERYVAVCTGAGEMAASSQLAECSALYRVLIPAIERLSLSSLKS
jgi:multidrug resistance protein MdtO